MVVVMILTSLSVAREREFGTFDQLLVAPFTPGEILLAQVDSGDSLRSGRFPGAGCRQRLVVRRAVSRQHCGTGP